MNGAQLVMLFWIVMLVILAAGVWYSTRKRKPALGTTPAIEAADCALCNTKPVVKETHVEPGLLTDTVTIDCECGLRWTGRHYGHLIEEWNETQRVMRRANVPPPGYRYPLTDGEGHVIEVVGPNGYVKEAP